MSVSESTNISGLPLCTLNSSRLTNQNGSTVNLPLPSSQTLAGGVNTYTMTNTVTCDTRLKLIKTVRGGPAPATDWTLLSTNTISGAAGPSGTTGVNAPVTPNVRYALSETNPHPEYIQFKDPNAVLIPGSSGSWFCVEVQPDGNTVIPGFSDGLNGGVTVPFGRYIRCEAINETSTLTLRKVVQNTHGGTATPANWQLTAAPTGDFPPGLPAQTVTGSTAGASFNVRPGVTYDIFESGGPAGYSLDSVTCDVQPGSNRVLSITLNPLDTGVCTFTNVDTPAHLTLVKQVVNDNGGTATPSQWTLSATGPTSISGTTGSAAVTNAEVSAGSYTLGETGPPGYAPGAWACTGGSVTGATVTVANGANVTCTIVNNDQPASLTLVKQVVNDNGGTATPAQWTVSATGPTPGVTGPGGSPAVTNATVNAGGYVLAESGPSGYAAGSWSCVGGTLSGTTVTVTNGAAVTCTIVNNDLPATLTLVKNVVNDNGGTATPGQWTLTASGPTPISGPGNSASVTNQTVNAGSYALSESGGPAGYTAGTWTCTGGTLAGASVTVANGANVTCTITNDDQPAHLTLVKTVTNDNGGTAVPTDWTLSAAGPTNISGTTGSASVTNAAVSAGTYALSETGPTGYAAGTWSCTAGTLTGASLVLPLGVSATCTINNNDQAATLTLVKTVTNDNGGTAVPTDWTLAAAGPTGISGVTGSPAVTNAPVSAGTYTLSETGPAGYAGGTWSCDGGTLTGSSLVLPLGDSATCTITNNDQPATLTLVKTVTNDNGGTAVPTDWTLSATGPSPISGTTGSTAVTGATVNAGTYTLSETGPSGYTTGTWSCTGGTLTGTSLVLPLGISATCTINNNDLAATLTLVKTVTNDNGGTAVPTDWTLTATGPTTITGATGSPAVTNAPVSAGTYALSETGPSGYTPGAWSCTAGTLSGASLVLTVGVSATCTINNNDQPATLTLVKTVTNDNGGTAVPTDWTLTATGPTPISGTTGSPEVTGASVSAGAYELIETGPGGYTALPWTCIGGTLTGNNVVVPNGGAVTCTIVNDDQPATLTLVKTVTNDNGGTAVPTDWTLGAAGPTPISGTTGSPEVTDATVNAGSYDLSETGPGGYTALPWTCIGGTLTGNNVVVPNGGAVTCTITNNDQPAQLTLVKQVTNDNGGTAVPTDWTLTATGQPPTSTTITGVTGDPAVTNATVPAGTYALSEAGPGPPAYTPGAWACTGATVTGSSVVVPNGGNVTCTINNDDQPASLTLVKTVTNDNGGTAVPTDWTLTATGQPPTSTTITGATGAPAVTNATVPAGTYALSETDGPPGYTPGAWSCTGGTVSADSVAVPNGGNVTCTINNGDKPASLTLVKTVTNDNGGTATPGDWTLTADGPTAVTGPGNSPQVTNQTVDAGDYPLSETGGPAGYTASDWTCTGGDLAGATVTVPNGGNVTCTINNDDEAGTFAVTKSSNPASGSTVQPGEVVTYTVTAIKTGGVDPSVVVVDDLSEVFNNATLVPGSVTATAGTADVAGDRLTWTIPALTGEETVSYQVRVNDGAYGVRLTNVITSEGSETCPAPMGFAAPIVGRLQLALQDPTEDCSTTHVTPRWTLDKTSNPASGSTVDPGSTIVYNLDVTNVSEAVVSNAVVTDDLSQVLAHGTLVSVPAGATLQGTTLTWTVPTLDPGESATLTYSVRLDADAIDVTVGNVATPGAGGACDPGCTTNHRTPPNGTTPSPELPDTGTNAGLLLRIGLLLLLIGGGAVLLARRAGRARQ